jgi:hypothetical protein
MSANQLRAFRPLGSNKTVNIVVGVANAVVAVPDTPFGTRALYCVNAGTQVVFVEFGLAGAVASLATSVAILPNTSKVFTFDNSLTHVAAIAPAIGSTLYITPGEGL